ncbi:MAG: gluconokinase [Bacteroidota bacterium]
MNHLIIVMGVSGCGKTTIGKRLAEELKIPFHDADDYHPTSNVEKMKSGTPLTDADRYPWLKLLATELETWLHTGGAVLACSALKEDYRKILSEKVSLDWVCLSGDFGTIFERMKTRDHFMKAEMLQSQFDTLEVPKYGIHVDVNETPEVIVRYIKNQLQSNG